jgi:amino acid adenylation domain-containing protein
MPALTDLLPLPTTPPTAPRVAATAIACGGDSLSYGQLGDVVARVRGTLNGAGMPPHQVVGLAPVGGLAWPALLVALLGSDRPVAPVDVTAETASRQLASLRPGWLLAGDDPAPLPPDATVATAESLAPVTPTGAPLRLLRLSWPGLSARPLPVGAAYLIPTSGTTGVAKTVIGGGAGLAHFLDWEVSTLPITSADRVSQLTGPTFDPVLRDVLSPLVAGGCCCVPPSREVLLDPTQLAGWLESERITVVHCVPTLLRALRGQLRAGRFPTLRHLVVAGEPLYPADVEPWLDALGDQVTLWNLYGPTETTLAKLAHRVVPADLARDRIPVGRPIPGCTAIVVDPNDPSRPRAPGELGELLLRTRWRSLGYLDRPELTAQRFIPNPFTGQPDDLVYRTGDLARVGDDGLVELAGRLDDLVKVHGVQVGMDHVEAALAALPGVRAAAVRAVQEPGGGTGLAGYLVADQQLDLAAARSSLAKRINPVAVPRTLTVLAELPTLASGKVDRAALPMPTPGANGQPTTALQRAVLSCWRGVLGDELPIHVDDPLLGVGAQSLEAAQIAARISERFGLDYSLGELLRAGTVSRVAAELERLLAARPHGVGEKVLPPLRAGPPPTEPAPLSYAQQRFWRLSRHAPDQAHLHYLWAVELAGSLDPARLEAALALLVERHPVERATFEDSRTGPTQTARAQTRWLLGRADVRGAVQPLAATRLAAEWAGRPFRFGQDALLRGLLVSLDRDRWLFALAGHVLVSDGWSKTVLLRELTTLYRSLGNTPQPEVDEVLGALPWSFADFARWERRHAPALAERHLPWWRRQLAGVPVTLALPYDRPATGQPNTTGGTVTASLDEASTRALRGLADRHGTSQTAVLSAGLLATLAAWCQTDRLAIRVPYPNRPHQGLEQVVGSFTDTLLLACGVAPAQPFADLVDDVAQGLLDALDHFVPYQLLLEELYPDLCHDDPGIFPVMLAPQPDVGAHFQLLGTTSREVTITLGTAINNLHLFTFARPGRLVCAVNYATPVLAHDTISRFTECLVATLREAVTAPGRSLGTLPTTSH